MAVEELKRRARKRLPTRDVELRTMKDVLALLGEHILSRVDVPRLGRRRGTTTYRRAEVVQAYKMFVTVNGREPTEAEWLGTAEHPGLLKEISRDTLYRYKRDYLTPTVRARARTLKSILRATVGTTRPS